MAEVVYTGFAELEGRLDLLKKALPGVVGAALYQEALIDMREAKKRCPVAPDGGTLRASGTVDRPEQVGRDIRVRSHFGGPAKEYAIAVHEHLSEHSPPSWQKAQNINWTASGTGPKFLESVILESASTINRRVADRISLEKIV